MVRSKIKTQNNLRILRELAEFGRHRSHDISDQALLLGIANLNADLAELKAKHATLPEWLEGLTSDGVVQAYRWKLEHHLATTDWSDEPEDPNNDPRDPVEITDFAKDENALKEWTDWIDLGEYVWKKGGDGWLIAFEGKVFRSTTEYRALSDIAILLSQPNRYVSPFKFADKAAQEPAKKLSKEIIDGLTTESFSISQLGGTDDDRFLTGSGKQHLKHCIHQLEEERQGVTDPQRKLEIEDTLKCLKGALRNKVGRFESLHATAARRAMEGIGYLIKKIRPSYPQLADHLKSRIKRQHNDLIYLLDSSNTINWKT